MIYFAQGAPRTPVKIGRARNAISRIRELNCGHSDALTILGVCDEKEFPERALHDLFAEHRIRGEWFKECAQILEFVNRNCHATDFDADLRLQRNDEERKLFLAEISAALRDDDRSGPVIASLMGVSVRLLENWRDQANVPNGWSLLLAARVSPTVKAVILRWLNEPIFTRLQNGPSHPHAGKRIEEMERFMKSQSEEGDQA